MKAIDKLKNHFIQFYSVLNDPKIPMNGICSHFGMGFLSGTTHVDLQLSSESKNRLLVTMYDRLYVINRKGRWEQKSYSRRTHLARREAIRQVLSEILGREVNVVDDWNGQHNHNGISVVYDVKVPTALNNAINNYRNMKDVFNYTDSENVRRLKFSAFIDYRCGEWIEEERGKYHVKQAREQVKHDTIEKLQQLKRMGLNDVFDICSQFVDKRLVEFASK